VQVLEIGENKMLEAVEESEAGARRAAEDEEQDEDARTAGLLEGVLLPPVPSSENPSLYSFYQHCSISWCCCSSCCSAVMSELS